MKLKNILNKIFRILKVTFAVIIIITTAFSSYEMFKLYNSTDKFNLSKIIVNNEFMLTKGEIIELSEAKRGIRVMDVDTELLRKNLKRSPFIVDADVRVVYPSAMVIRVTENKPIAYVNENNILKYVGNNGEILGKVIPDKSYDLPIITDNEINVKVIDYLNTAYNMSQFVYHQISEIKYTVRGVEINLIKASANVVIGRNDFEKKIVLLENFIREEYDNITFSKVDYIDFRFDKQVILKERQTSENKM
ncbi:MAG: FtsQ-type POTRA domain-containing protein [Candidatus Delongbacteria bacterium]|nr:FtsQ-type POTRA domain-containing protein [Candidatus Delongbacteria bacterium]